MNKVLGMTLALGMVVSAAKAQTQQASAVAAASKVNAVTSALSKMAPAAKAGFGKYMTTAQMATLKSSLTLSPKNAVLVDSLVTQMASAKDAEGGARVGAVMAAVGNQESEITSDKKLVGSLALYNLANGRQLLTGFSTKSHAKFIAAMGAVVNASKDDAKSSADVNASIEAGLKAAGVNAAEVASNCSGSAPAFTR